MAFNGHFSALPRSWALFVEIFINFTVLFGPLGARNPQHKSVQMRAPSPAPSVIPGEQCRPPSSPRCRHPDSRKASERFHQLASRLEGPCAWFPAGFARSLEVTRLA